ncbi:sugar ABC transporter permease [Gracilibacillus sp. YIM 98692]|uniref:carbohydrate ABC transporter permease n=1 Tax=Gracilibacillus sp. YIM 98692 TaxID=2663532 RepID=UPI0013D5C194|nr:sugar ABC transporter permease [Gracilibacillus sp. YIM 98692]
MSQSTETQTMNLDRKESNLLKRMKKNRAAYLFILPSIILLTVFMVFPLIYSIIMSFYRWDGFSTPNFLGIDNYIRLLNHDNFLLALKNNAIFMVLFTTGTVVLGFLFAVAISRKVPGWRIYKFVFFIPVMLVTAVIAVLWGKIYEPSYGLLNSFLDLIGLESLQQLWLGNPDITLYSIICVAIWQVSGWCMLLFLAAIEGIPNEVHDAATIDGVSPFQRIILIIMPMVKRMGFILVMLQIIASVKTFDLIYVMTGGGPFYASEVLGTILYREAFENQRFGYASSISVVMTIIIAIITISYLKFTQVSEQEK